MRFVPMGFCAHCDTTECVRWWTGRGKCHLHKKVHCWYIFGVGIVFFLYVHWQLKFQNMTEQKGWLNKTETLLEPYWNPFMEPVFCGKKKKSHLQFCFLGSIYYEQIFRGPADQLFLSFHFSLDTYISSRPFPHEILYLNKGITQSSSKLNKFSCFLINPHCSSSPDLSHSPLFLHQDMILLICLWQ